MEHVTETITKIAGKRIQAVEVVGQSRDLGKQELAFNGRPFVLCGLPLRRPPKTQLVHERRNGELFLEVVPDPRYGLPFGQDRLIPILVSSIALKQGSPIVRFRQFAETLPAEELAVVKKVPFKELNLAGLGMHGYGCLGGSPSMKFEDRTARPPAIV